ncbi:hypothetical protein RDI58_027444 [Solanum bulbocastanum]|uniref:Transmembrane protein n=1 Tax=Solanum bulbocastanum TaxID=147425 RepID=A0AAN8Y4C1_SOLBU
MELRARWCKIWLTGCGSPAMEPRRSWSRSFELAGLRESCNNNQNKIVKGKGEGVWFVGCWKSEGKGAGFGRGLVGFEVWFAGVLVGCLGVFVRWKKWEMKATIRRISLLVGEKGLGLWFRRK